MPFTSPCAEVYSGHSSSLFSSDIFFDGNDHGFTHTVYLVLYMLLLLCLRTTGRGGTCATGRAA